MCENLMCKNKTSTYMQTISWLKVLTLVLDFHSCCSTVWVLGMKLYSVNNCCFRIARVVCSLTHGCCAPGELLDEVHIPVHILEAYF